MHAPGRRTLWHLTIIKKYLVWFFLSAQKMQKLHLRVKLWCVVCIVLPEEASCDREQHGHLVSFIHYSHSQTLCGERLRGEKSIKEFNKRVLVCVRAIIKNVTSLCKIARKIKVVFFFSPQKQWERLHGPHNVLSGDMKDKFHKPPELIPAPPTLVKPTCCLPFYLWRQTWYGFCFVRSYQETRMLAGESAAREHICSSAHLMLLNLLYRHPPAAHVHGHTRRQH